MTVGTVRARGIRTLLMLFGSLRFVLRLVQQGTRSRAGTFEPHGE